MLLQSTTLGAAGMALNPALSVGRAFAGSAPEVPQMKSFEFEETTISDLQARLKSGELTAHSLAQSYLRRIQEIDKNGPTLNSVIELNSATSEVESARPACPNPATFTMLEAAIALIRIEARLTSIGVRASLSA